VWLLPAPLVGLTRHLWRQGNKEAKQQDEGEASVLCSVEFIVNSMKVKPAPGRSAEPAVGWQPEPKPAS